MKKSVKDFVKKYKKLVSWDLELKLWKSCLQKKVILTNITE